MCLPRLHVHRWVSLAAIAAVLIGLLPTWAAAAPARQDDQIGPNLLVNGNFEAPAVIQDGIGEIQVVEGWRAWYVDWPPSYAVAPSSCYQSNGKIRDNGCFWMRPEFRDTIRQSNANRVHTGDRAQKYFSFGRMHEGGIYQQVHNVPIGAKLRFSIYIQAWMCSDAGASPDCRNDRSDQPSDMHLRIGIDPTGGTDPFSPKIVWSYESPAWDVWTRFQSEAIAESSTVTVFTHSRPDWDWARMNNDVYLDDADLVTVGPVPTQPPPTPDPAAEPPAQPQAELPAAPVQELPAAPQPVAQPLARSDGTRVHSVVYGDTLLGIALAYGVTVDEVVSWNNLSSGDFLQIGQELVVQTPPGWTPPQASAPAAATPESQPAATMAPGAQPDAATASTPGAPAAVAAAPAGLCVVAFEDQNMNTLYDNSEQLVTGARFEVMAGANVVQSHSTDGSEPYCFANLAPGAYIVAIKSADGYKATSVEKMGVSVAAGQTVNVAFGSVSTGKAPADKGNTKATTLLQSGSKATATASAAPAANPLAQVGGFVVVASGLLVLVAAVAIGTMMSRRNI